MQMSVWWHVYFVENQNVNVFIKSFNIKSHDFFFNFEHTEEFGEQNWCKNFKFFFCLFNTKHLFKIFKTCSQNIMFTQLMISNKQNQLMQNVFKVKNQKIKINKLNIIEQKKIFFCFHNRMSKLMIFAFHNFMFFQIWLKIQFQKKWFHITCINKI